MRSQPIATVSSITNVSKDTFASGPLPKSDSVQSLVSLINCPPPPIARTAPEETAIRAVDNHGHTHCISVESRTDSLSLSGLHLQTVKLTALEIATALTQLSLAANSLHVIDLSSLATCPSLTVLTLNSNKLSTIDLAPLAYCRKLQRLWLHDNHLQSIDLSPLKACTTLRSLYLEDNSIHNTTIDLSPLSYTSNIRSLRLGGNRLAANLDVTPLFQCPALSVFNVDTSVSIVADGDSTFARVSPALRRIVLDITFSGNPIPLCEDIPVINPSAIQPPRPQHVGRVRRKVSPPGSPPGGVTKRKHLAPTPPPSTTTPACAPLIVKILLVGFRRLARYAAEDGLSKRGKVIIRASNNDVATSNPTLLLDSHLVILHTPSEKTLRQVTVVVGRIPTVVMGTERYRSTADNQKLQLLDNFNFYSDPLSEEDTRVVYHMAKCFATGGEEESPGNAVMAVDSAGPMGQQQQVDSSPVSEDGCDENASSTASAGGSLRKSYSESSMSTALSDTDIEFEDIDDVDDEIGHVSEKSLLRSSRDGSSSAHFQRSKSEDFLAPDASTVGKSRRGRPMTTWLEVTRRLTDRAMRRSGRGWGGYLGGELSVHGRNKLRAERSSVQAAFTDLGGYATFDSCAGIARSCGLPKCAGRLLFRAALGSAFDIEATTPEAGVPNPPMERKYKRISVESFLRYWDSRLKSYDGEERLSNILVDSHMTKSIGVERCTGHSQYGAPSKSKKSPSKSDSLISSIDVLGYVNKYAIARSRGASSCLDIQEAACSFNIPNDISCPCDAGIEALIIAFMEGRRSRFGAFALVKLSEAIAIGSSLVMYELRSRSKNRVGGRARPVCPKEVRDGKLNAALIAAEVGIFEGVANGLSMDQIRSVKSNFATEMVPGFLARLGGTAVDVKLSVSDVQSFCASRKTLLPCAVKLLMATHCRDAERMSLSEFSILLSVLNNITSNGAVDYMFSVIDMDHDERWGVADLRHFHMEKEKLWLEDGMAVSDLRDLWVNLVDMTQAKDAKRGIRRREVMRLASKERKLVMQWLLFVDDDHSLLNLRRTMELNENSASPLQVM